MPKEPEPPGNEHALEELRDLIRSGRGLAFVGAGASAGLYPLWGELLGQLAGEAVRRGVATEAEHAYWIGSSTDPADAVAGIRKYLSPSILGVKLREIFRPKAGPDGRRFTLIHEAVLRLPFRGLVTTNYDPGLLEARLSVRPDVAASGYATWADDDLVRLWLTGEIFDEQGCPILFNGQKRG